MTFLRWLTIPDADVRAYRGASASDPKLTLANLEVVDHMGYVRILLGASKIRVLCPRLIQGLLVVLLMSGLGWSNPSRAQTTAAQVLPAESKAVRVRIVNYKQSKVYEAIVPDGPAKLLEANPVDAQRDPIGELVAHLMEKRVALQRAAATLPSQGRWLRWACFSPDHQFVLAGMQDQATTAVTEAAVYKVSDMSVIMSIDSGRIIQDFKWSEDSKSLVVLESSEHMSKSPWGLLAALSGHPIELQTYFLRTVLVESRANSSLEITDNIENGEAELAR